jgi:enterobactin synthetase component D
VGKATGGNAPASDMQELMLALPLALRDLPGFVRAYTVVFEANCFTREALVVEFTLDQFSPVAFAQAGIALPPTIMNAVPKRQAEFFFGRLAASWALVRTGHEVVTIKTGRMREPLFPTATVGSITHTTKFAAAVVASARTCGGIGIDIEMPVEPDAIESVEQLVLSVEELAIVKASSELSYPVLLALVFSAKESFYKAVFGSIGRILDFSAIRLRRIDGGGKGLHFQCSSILSARWREGTPVCVHYRVFPTGEIMTCFDWQP